MNVRYRITLTSDEHEQLSTFVQGGKGAFRRLKRAQILLAASGGSTDADIAVQRRSTERSVASWRRVLKLR